MMRLHRRAGDAKRSFKGVAYQCGANPRHVMVDGDSDTVDRALGIQETLSGMETVS